MISLTELEVKGLLDLDELMPVLRQALIDFSAGRVTQPVRAILPIDRYSGFAGLMPAVYGDVFGAKFVTVFPENASRGIPTHLATILLFRAETGEPLAVMDGTHITAWRTAAVSALATDELADAQSRNLTILGSGVQARTHAAMLKRVRTFHTVRVWSRRPAHAQQFASEIGALATGIEEAVRSADVLITVTNASEPLFRSEWLKPNAYVNAVGAVGPMHKELEDDVIKDAAVFVESRESAMCESAEIMQSGASLYAELGEIFSGKVEKPNNRRIVYKSLGIGVEDIAAAKMVYLKAMGVKSL